MSDDTVPPEHEDILNTLKPKLETWQNCPDLVDAFARLLRATWEFIAQLLGNLGAQAVISRSLHVASRRSPILQELKILNDGVDFGEFRAHIVRKECNPQEVMAAFLLLSIMIFQTLSEITGDVLTGPLLHQLGTEEGTGGEKTGDGG